MHEQVSFRSYWIARIAAEIPHVMSHIQIQNDASHYVDKMVRCILLFIKIGSLFLESLWLKIK